VGGALHGRGAGGLQGVGRWTAGRRADGLQGRGYDRALRVMPPARAHHPRDATPEGAASGRARAPRADARVPLSACLIVRDEELRLPDCLASVAFCEEIIVVDSGSRDRTVEIARAAGATVIERPWEGYASQRNFALDRASHDWVLEIDADERVSELLRDELVEFLEATGDRVGVVGDQETIAAIPLRHVFLGRRLGPSALYPMYRHRFFSRADHRHDERRTVHEGLAPDGPTHAFVGELEHRLADDWGEALGDFLSYAQLQAASLTPPPGGRAYLNGIVLRPAAKLVWRVLAFAGWRDGWQGLVHIGLGAASDSFVWTQLMWSRLHGGGASVPQRKDAGDGHFGRRAHRGAVRIVAVADGPEAVQRAIAWLARARAQGADVALIAPQAACEQIVSGSNLPPQDERPPHVRPVARLTPLQLARAFETEQQLRPIDAFIGFGRSSGRLLSRYTRLLRLTCVLSETVTPEQAIARGLAARPR